MAINVGDESYVAWPDSVSSLRSVVASQQDSLRRSRSALVEAAQELQHVHRQVLELSVRVVEQVIHGGIARHSKGKADYLAMVADGISRKLHMQHAQLTQHIYTLEVQAAMHSMLSTLKDNHADVRVRVRECEEKLAQYDSARGMNSMVKEYAELQAEAQRVGAEILRLKGGT